MVCYPTSLFGLYKTLHDFCRLMGVSSYLLSTPPLLFLRCRQTRGYLIITLYNQQTDETLCLDFFFAHFPNCTLFLFQSIP